MRSPGFKESGPTFTCEKANVSKGSVRCKIVYNSAALKSWCFPACHRPYRVDQEAPSSRPQEGSRT